MHLFNKKMFGSRNTTLIISNDEINNIMKLIKSLEESGLLIKVVSETIKNKSKEYKRGFIGVLLGTLGTSLLGNIFTGKDTIRTREGAIATNRGRGKIRVGQNF